MAELYERFVALYPYPHERIRHGAPRAELNRRYLDHLYEGKNRGTTPIVVALTRPCSGPLRITSPCAPQRPCRTSPPTPLNGTH